MTGPTRYVTAPSFEEIEAAWFELLQGELGIERDRNTAALAQAMADFLRREADAGVPIFAGGEPLSAVSSAEVAKRTAAAIATLLYGGDQ